MPGHVSDVCEPGLRHDASEPQQGVSTPKLRFELLWIHFPAEFETDLFCVVGETEAGRVGLIRCLFSARYRVFPPQTSVVFPYMMRICCQNKPPYLSLHKTSAPLQRLCFCSDDPVMISALLIFSKQTEGGGVTLSAQLFYGDPKANGHRFPAFLRAIKTIQRSDGDLCFAIGRRAALL